LTLVVGILILGKIGFGAVLRLTGAIVNRTKKVKIKEEYGG
jgi:hypothetical protein